MMLMIPFDSDAPPAGLDAPPDAFPSPPVQTKAQELPFSEISWQNFERLCYRLVKASASVEHCARYGLQGEAQEGIDIFARVEGGKYDCWQAKRTKNFGAAKLKDAATLFAQGSWSGKSQKFVIAVQASLNATATQNEIERQVARFKLKGIEFQALGREQLTEILCKHPTIIDDFFGRAWVVAILGDEVAAGLQRLDGAEFAKVRRQLGNFYTAHFHVLDPGSFGSIGDDAARPPLTLLERFIRPHLIVRDGRGEHGDGAPHDTNDTHLRGVVTPSDVAPYRGVEQQSVYRSQPQMRRSSIAEWTASGDSFAIVGEAGLGKSTLLRVIALDLLQQQSVFPTLAERWGGYLPLHISFAAWAREVAQTNGLVSLKAMVRRSLQTYLTANIEQLLDRAIDEKRVLLLVDGLDEWSDEQAARTALTTLVTTAETHLIPAIVTGRPRGLARIGTLPATWKRAEIAPLLRDQQAALAKRWFDRYSTPLAAEASPHLLPDRAELFLGELARDQGLVTLAATPLLLIGLVTLRLRGKVLPRNRIDAFQQLVELLLEEHPTHRATAAGDARARFHYAEDALLRRSAIARLAFMVREQGGGAGFPIDHAKRVLADFLSAPDGFDLEPAKAKAAAAEILAVNAETQGMLIEKAPGEVGFAHASFEEYLGAEYLHSKPFEDVLAFVEAQAGEPRWRNVIANLLAIVSRRDEFDRLVATIEQPGDDLLTHAYRQGVLAEIAFGSSTRFPATGKRLAKNALAQIELGEWMPLRQDGLRAALRAIGDPAVGSMVEARLTRWAPLRQEFRAGIIEVLAEGERLPDIAETLWLAMHDDDRGTQRAAASAYARWFKDDPAASDRLVEALSQAARPHVAAAYLECLMLGWLEDERLDSIFAEARRSFNPTLRLLAIVGLTMRGEAPNDAKEELLYLQSLWSGLDYADKPLVSWCLNTSWVDDPELINGAVNRMTPGSQSRWEYDTGKSYLLNCSPDNDAVQAWLLHELTRRDHINTMGVNRVWSGIGRFAQANAQIREAAVKQWMAKDSHFHLRELQEFVALIPDGRLKAVAIDVLNGKEGFEKHWACCALLAGWGADDPEVQTLFAQIRHWPAERLLNLAALLPDIESDPKTCRRKLLEIAALAVARRDLIASGFDRCGCDGADNEAVAATLAGNATSFGGRPYSILFKTFQEHPDVQKLAETLLDDAEAPLASLAHMAGRSAAVRETILRAAVPLPFELRSGIADAAIASGIGTTLGERLSRYDQETIGDLKVRLAIGYYGSLAKSDKNVAVLPRLLSEIVSYGIDLESKRAAALAGFAILDELPQLVALGEHGKPVNLSMGSYTVPISAIARLMCEHWGKLRELFGDGLEARFESLGSVKMSRVLGEGAYLSEAARAEFVQAAEAGTMDLSPASLRTLAIVRPGSALLRDRCLSALGKGSHGNEQVRLDAEIAQILADAMPQDPEILQALIARTERWASSSSILTLGIYSPGHPTLKPFLSQTEYLIAEFGGWSAAAQIVGPFADTDQFVRFVIGLITRGGFYARFDVQKFANQAIEARLRHDDDVVERMTDAISHGAHPSVLATFPRLLASAGRMSGLLRTRIVELLAAHAKEQLLPLAGYDAVADGIRSVRLAMFDALHFGAEV